MSLQSVRGTQDLLPEVQVQHNMVIETARGLAEKFGFREMATPIFEFTEVFKRTLGDASDIVNKEMYTFQDKGQEWLTLRPEGTASIARSFISEGLQQRTPFKVFYQGPMFRYERPQKGRFRQFHQFGVELLGAATPFADVEVIALGHQILKALEVDTLSYLEINSIGDAESRKTYVEKLVKYLSQHQLKLSADSQKRLTTNPLRILDSKSAEDQEILKNAPVISECYSETSKQFFDTVTAMLKDYGIPFNHNPFLVRGLDYYSHCVFEFKTNALGAQDAILSGGRYDTLIKTMGGPDTPSVGWAAGIERLVMLTPRKAVQTRGVAVIPVHESVEQKAFKLAYDLRVAGLEADIGYSGNMSKRMKRASQKNCVAAIVVGPEELGRGEVVVKTLDDGQQKTLKLSELEGFLKSLKS